ncbi:hypothetical protein H0H87_006401 [Tephrocybe sp. NHM501043]|nr:hypothetical protein H0H87_006401 [Tephrocybe sp. NHM501043]
MTDDEKLSDGPPPGLFFAGSDDEDNPEDVIMDQSHTPAATTPSASSPPGLFLPDSDDEGVTENIYASPPHPKRRLIFDDDQDDEIRLPSPVPYRRASSVQSIQEVEAKSLSVTPQPVSTRRNEPAPKKRRLSTPPLATTPDFPPTYLGEILVPNAWSNVSGKGYIKCNQSVKIHRDEQDEPHMGSSKFNGPQGKKKGDGKKQMSLTAMLKPQPSKVKKKVKGDKIVRLLNSKGTEFGRLPTDVSWWVSKLLDLGIVEFRGMMTDCPDKLTIGASLIVTIQVYILASAFKSPTILNTDDQPMTMFGEGQETLDEKTLRERKEAVLRLFDVIGLKPQAGANVRAPNDEAKIQETLSRIAKHKSKKVTEIVGDNEEIEVDDAEDLSKNDIDAIYKRAQHNDRTMGIMEPSDTFALTLRGYQKQALFWMHSLESGKMDARESSSMHPLWSQYIFPSEPTNKGVIDLTTDDKMFYMNPYSGEMSLEFPKSERKFRGGILA